MAKVPSKTVVIVGAAWAGINVAHGLLKQVPNVKVSLIDPSGKRSAADISIQR
jgi:NADH dehydrogenase FAD-containing subunit